MGKLKSKKTEPFDFSQFWFIGSILFAVLIFSGISLLILIFMDWIFKTESPLWLTVIVALIGGFSAMILANAGNCA